MRSRARARSASVWISKCIAPSVWRCLCRPSQAAFRFSRDIEGQLSESNPGDAGGDNLFTAMCDGVQTLKVPRAKLFCSSSAKTHHGTYLRNRQAENKVGCGAYG